MSSTLPKPPEVMDTIDTVSRICSNCKYWLLNKADSKSPWGLCSYISKQVVDLDNKDPMGLVYAKAGTLPEGSQLITSAAFGCKLFQPKG